MTAKPFTLANNDERIFILNLRGRAPAKNTTTEVLNRSLQREIISETGERKMVYQITNDEYQKLMKFKNIPDDFKAKVDSEGWLAKNFSTVQYCVNMYMASQPSHNIVYTATSKAKDTNATKIYKILYYYHLQGYDIPNIKLRLSEEQERTVNHTRGVCVVNSGPGTGKTTTAAHKAVKLMNEGVIVISYTCATVDNVIERMMGLINDTDDISPDIKKRPKIWVPTIDALSRKVIQKELAQAAGDNYELVVDIALRDIGTYTSVFLDTDGTPLYQHIIVDEAQDISDSRFKLLEAIYTHWNFRSITIIGDPRQRLSVSSGARYQELIRKGHLRTLELEDNSEYTFERPLLLNYKQTFRFKNPIHLELCNILSAQRPLIHAPLENAVAPELQIPRDSAPKIVKMSKPEQVSEAIIKLRQEGVPFSEICIVSPAVKADNATTAKLKHIRELLAKADIFCDDTKSDNIIYVSSIQSVKGLEFDHVFFIGARDFPEQYNKVYGDVNDGISMNFVVNTRAKIALSYLTDETMRAPLGVPEELMVGGKPVANITRTETQRNAIRTEEIDPDNLDTFHSSNYFHIFSEEITTSKFDASPRKQELQYEIISMVLALLQGLNIPKKATDLRYLETQESRKRFLSTDYYDLSLPGKKIVNGQGNILRIAPDEATYITEEQTEIFMSLREQYDETDLTSHKNYKELMTGKKSSLKDVSHIANISMVLKALISKYNDPDNETDVPYHTVIKEKIKASAIACKKLILIFTDNLYLGSLVKKMDSRKEVICVSLTKGTCRKIVKADFQEFRYRYMVNALYSLTAHKQLIQQRARYSIADADIRTPWLFVDTEFISRTEDKSGTIYDIAIINGFNIYKSIVSLVDCGRENYQRVAPPLVIPYHQFEGSPTINDLRRLFRQLYLNTKPLVHYYGAPHDIAFFYEDNEYYEELKERGSKETNDWRMREDLEYDVNFKDICKKGKFGTGKLGEMYNTTLNCDHTTMPHIITHTAVSDTLLLMEIVMTSDLSFATNNTPSSPYTIAGVPSEAAASE